MSVFLSGDLLERLCVYFLHLSQELFRESHFGENATFFFLFILQNKARCEIIYTHLHTHTEKEKETRANTSITKGIA